MTETERLPSVGESDVIDTANEAWDDGKQSWYAAALDFAAKSLGPGDNRRECLIIGSPMPEVQHIAGMGWRVTYVDVRKPPADLDHFVECDATRLMFPDESVDAVSSTCVLCHAGLGRYGDPVKPNGDLLMLREIARVLKPGGSAAIMVGPTIAGHEMKSSVVYGNVHRIYRPEDVASMLRGVRLELQESAIFETPEPQMYGHVKYAYMSVLVRKPG
jgi:SAM-dependent methyltransferase